MMSTVMGVFALLAVALGFVIGFYTQQAISASSTSVTMTTQARDTMHQQAIQSVSQTNIEQYER